MSTDTQSSSSTKQKVVGYDEFVDGQLSKVRSYIKLSDLAGRAITLAATVMLSLILLVIVDHWVCDLGRWGRLGALVSLVLGAGYYFIRYLLPELVRQINPVYAAQVIERTEPSLKNSLINFVMLRPKREQLMDVVYQEVEHQAAQRLSKVEIDTTVDQTSLIRILLAFLFILCAFAGYTMLSPKSPFRTLARIASPFSDIARPSRVQISDVQPGHATVYAGERLDVAANVADIRDDESVWLVYSTNDGQFTDERIELQESDQSLLRYLGTLPDNGSRIEQDLAYRIEAGDAVAGPYRVTVSPAPTMFIEEIRYEYPAYTDLTAKTVVEQGDISAVEGTRVTIKARANHEIRAARLEFDPVRQEEGTAFKASRRINMKHTGRIAEVSFVLSLKEDRRSATHESYHLRFTSSDGQMNANPVEYPIQVAPDLSPEIEILLPEKIRIQVPVNYQQRIDVRAVDPDFGLAAVKLEAVKGRKKIINKQLLDEPGTGQRVVSYPFRPSQLGLKVGDFVVYRAKAADNRQDPLTQSAAPNVTVTDNYAIEIVAAAHGGEADLPPGLTPDEPENQGGEEDNGPQSGPGAGQDGEDGSGSGSEQGEDEGEGGEGSEGDSGEGQGGEGQGSQAGEESDGGDQNGDGQAAGGEADGQNGDGQPSRDNAGGAQQGDSAEPPGSGESNAGPGESGEGSRDTKGEPGKENSTGSQGDSQAGDTGEGQIGDASEGQGDAEGRSGQSQDGEPKDAGEKSVNQGASGDEEQASEPLAGDGSEDPDAFDRILEHMRQKNGEQPDGTPRGNGQNPGENQPADDGEADSDASPDDQPEGDQPAGTEAEEMPGNQGDEESQSAVESGESDSMSEGTDEEPSDEQQPSDGQSGRGQSAESEGQAGEGQQTAGPEGDAGSGQSGQEAGQSGESSGEKSGDQQVGQDGNPASSPDGQPASAPDGKETGEGGEPTAGKEQDGQSSEGTDSPESHESEPGSNGEAAEGEGQTGEGQTGEGQTGEGQAGEGQTGEGQTGEGQAGEGQAGEGQAGEDETDQQAESNSSGAEGDPPPAETPPNGQPSDSGPSAAQDSTQGSISGESPTGGDADVPGEEAVEPGGDQANLEYTRKATDLALKYLKDEQPDPDLLKKLGWTPDQMNEFVERWQGLQEQAQQPGSSGLEGRRELDEALRSLGLHPGRDRLRGAGSRVDSSNRVRDAGTRSLPPAEYIDQYKAYLRSRGVDQSDGR